MKLVKTFIGLAVLIGMIMVAWKAMPPYYANYQLQDYVERQAPIESYTTHSEQDIADIMAKKAAELEIPLKAENFKVQRIGNDLTISADYTVTVDMPIYPFDLHFTVSTKNKKL